MPSTFSSVIRASVLRPGPELMACATSSGLTGKGKARCASSDKVITGMVFLVRYFFRYARLLIMAYATQKCIGLRLNFNQLNEFAL